MFVKYRLRCLLLICLSASQVRSQSLDSARLQFNNEGLSVSLGTGLWGTPIPVDLDNDGRMDIVMSGRDVPFRGVYFFRNAGTQERPFFSKPIKLSSEAFFNTQASYVNDTLYVISGAGKEFLDFKRNILSKPRNIKPDVMPGHDFKKIRSNMWSYVDFDGDGDRDIIVGIDDWGDYGWDNAYDSAGVWKNGPLRGFVYLLENQDGKYINKGKLVAAGKVIETFGAPGANMADLDGDGDLDLICGEFLDKLTWFENTGSRKKPVFAEGRTLVDEAGDTIRLRVQMITPVVVDFDRDGHTDLIVGDEDGTVVFIRNTGKKKKRMPVFKAPVVLMQEAGNLKFGALTAPVSVDWDGDGFEDIISGNSSGSIAFIKNLDGGVPPKWAAPVLLKAGEKELRIVAGKNGSIQGPAEAKWGYTTLSVADWDNDGKKDLIVSSIWGKVVWYRNTGDLYQLEGPFSVKVDWGAGPVPKPGWNWWEPEAGELVTQWRTTPFATDWNGDGLQDLVMLDHEGYLSYFERFRKGEELLLRPGQRIFFLEDGSVLDHNNKIKLTPESLPRPLRLNAGTGGASGRRKFCLADWDGDGDPDLLVNSSNVCWFENVRTGNGNVYFVNRGDITNMQIAGHDTSPSPVNWKRSKFPDLILGAEDGHFYWIKNPGNGK